MKNTNKLFAFMLAAFLILGGTAQASFPVKNEVKKEQATEVAKEELQTTPAPALDELSTPTEPKQEAKQKNLKEKAKALLNKYLKKADGDWDIYSILAFGFGVVGLVFLPIHLLVSSIIGIAAIVLSIIGLMKTSNGQRGKGFAIAGLILGIIEVLIIFLLIGLLLAVASV